jgi:hypothetical protein
MKPRPGEKADETEDGEWLPPEEAERRRDDALRRALSMPPTRKAKGGGTKARVTVKRTDRREER